ncbi:cisplatin damage response ATP-dependent DNA ligase [Allorhizobium sp. BGMRC 0089]|uniref:cisplatin damage response ATP-dependent DNA ligase n=1 Tax=Allorhizobium sonneratiae TaxID=2934936 RepID=UPI00203349AF|nr:cisplatin damage response ATP-dependent DNA ligase [Allorhizobium sonneratiae]MCM2294771.1 cisplatin damage response ATP-dependent DNA ligase [Allorhizobium sonneratiae]
MQAFAALLDRLVLTPGRNDKLTLLSDYFAATPDPDRGYALGVLTGTLDLKSVKPAMLKELVLERMDPILFGYSYDYIGDLAETIALVWDQERRHQTHETTPRLSAVVQTMQTLGKSALRAELVSLLNRLAPSERFAFLKMVTGGLRIGVSARLAKQALARFSEKPVEEIESLWHGLKPPYEDLFAWLENRSVKPVLSTPAIFHSVMLSNPVMEGDLDGLDPADYAAEWKWDGIRVQLSSHSGVTRLYSRSGDDISAAFPDILSACHVEGVIDGELLVGGTLRSQSPTRSFSDLQQRLNRKTVTNKLLQDYPAFIRAYDLLFDGADDIRSHPFHERRHRLARLIEQLPEDRFDLSPLVDFSSFDQLDHLRKTPPDPVIEGIMLKRRDSPYQAGRAKGPWFKWKKQPLTVDAVLLYAQRGHGKRSSFYSDFTFGVWMQTANGEELVPVGKAYFGFTDEELKELDSYVRNNTVDRYGPVRAIRAEPDHGFVVEVAFEGLNRSTRHKSGVAMRFPRISRLRRDKQPSEADRLDTLVRLIT